MTTADAYKKIINTLKRKKNGVTTADICAATALPLPAVRELLPKAADEYAGELQVTQSGEILYSFPNGFTSRYRGFNAGFKKAAKILSGAFKAVLVFLFKAWIVIMLIGYFALFLALALAGVVLSVVVQSKSSDRGRRGARLTPGLFQILWRIWFVQEITRPRYGRYPNVPVTQNKEKGRPMHKAVFSFVFGEGDPNKGFEDMENKAVISYIQANRGVISLAEYMAFSGKDSAQANEAILSFCSKYGGSPEVTEEGTLVFRFDDLLLRANTGGFSELSPPVKRLKTFSFNKKSMNGWFIAINAVNLLFGSYFLYNAVNSGLLVTDIQYQAASYLYGFTHIIMSFFTQNPHTLISIALGVVPVVFSILFWLIPAIRKHMENKENESIKLSNFKKLGFTKIWTNPNNVKIADLIPQTAECRPQNSVAAADRVIKDLGAISSPQVDAGENGKLCYSFKDLEKEKIALAGYRNSLDPKRAEVGSTVFDTGK
ncbi:MAG: hypothetical protein LBI04_06900 [Treponema sp.]|jgi:hypothetical protein|nr:hypothetical protein [Treponema sp.]